MIDLKGLSNPGNRGTINVLHNYLVQSKVPVRLKCYDYSLCYLSKRNEIQELVVLLHSQALWQSATKLRDDWCQGWTVFECEISYRSLKIMLWFKGANKGSSLCSGHFFQVQDQD